MPDTPKQWQEECHKASLGNDENVRVSQLGDLGKFFVGDMSLKTHMTLKPKITKWVLKWFKYLQISSNASHHSPFVRRGVSWFRTLAQDTKTKLNGHFRRGTSSKWLQDVHGDFTTLILRKRCVKAGEIREDQENAFKKSRNSPSWKSSPIPMMIMMVCNALKSVCWCFTGSPGHRYANGCNGKWHPILQVLQGTCYGKLPTHSFAWRFPAALCSTPAQSMSSTFHLDLSRIKRTRSQNLFKSRVVWCKLNLTENSDSLVLTCFWHVMVMEVVAGTPAPSSVEWSANCSRTGTWQRSTRVTWWSTSCHLGCASAASVPFPRHCATHCYAAVASVQRRRSFLAPWDLHVPYLPANEGNIFKIRYRTSWIFNNFHPFFH